MNPRTRIELVWPDKYDGQGKRNRTPPSPVPLEVVETHVSRGRSGLHDDAWHNQLIAGDNLRVMDALMERFAGRVDLIYVDPPFGTGSAFQVTSRIGDEGRRTVGARAYRDSWPNGRAGYLGFMADRLHRMRDLLAPTGNLVVHVDFRMAHHLRLVLDEIFGENRLVNEVIWTYRSGGGSRRRFGRKHDTLLVYARSARHYFDANAPEARVPHDAVIPRKWAGKFDPRGKVRPDVWDVSRPPNHSREWLGYPTQKPEALLRIPVSVLCPPDGLVADFFCGSGTTLAVAEALGRRWIGCDNSPMAIHVARKRMLEAASRRSFQVLAADTTFAPHGVLDVRMVRVGPRAVRVRLEDYRDDTTPSSLAASLESSLETDPESSLEVRPDSSLGLHPGHSLPPRGSAPPETTSRTWSDRIDGWAVDFDYDGTTFRPTWTAVRSRKTPVLPLESREHVYEDSGEHLVRVTAYDVSGGQAHHTLRVAPETG